MSNRSVCIFTNTIVHIRQTAQAFAVQAPKVLYIYIYMYVKSQLKYDIHIDASFIIGIFTHKHIRDCAENKTDVNQTDVKR